MKSTCLKTVSALSLFASAAFAGSALANSDKALQTPAAEALSLGVSLNTDSFFGFYPSFAGSYGLSDTLDFTVYGTYWAGGVAANNGINGGWDDWTEFGAGVAFSPTDYLTINPQIGFLSGNLLSAGAAANVQGDVGEGWVPNLTVNLNSADYEGQFYAGFYLPIQNNGNRTEFLHTWLSAGRKLNNVFSAGGHVEWLSGGNSFDEDTMFVWAGPYVQFRNEDKGLFVRFAGGFEFDAAGTADSGTFWKSTVGFSF